MNNKVAHFHFYSLGGKISKRILIKSLKSIVTGTKKKLEHLSEASAALGY